MAEADPSLIIVSEGHVKKCPGGCGGTVVADTTKTHVLHELDVKCTWWDATPAHEILAYVLGTKLN